MAYHRSKSQADLKILERPSWFTPARLLVGVGMLSGVLVLVVLWLLTVTRKNIALGRAQRELQDAHDTLEDKVRERSAQLQVEMTARKTAEVQSKAVLVERTRLEVTDAADTLARVAAQLRQWHQQAPIEALGIASFGPLQLDSGHADYGHQFGEHGVGEATGSRSNHRPCPPRAPRRMVEI